MFLVFSGVAYNSNQEDEESCISESTVDEPFDCDYESSENHTNTDLFSPGIFYGMLKACLEKVPQAIQDDQGGMLKAINRHRTKILEAIEVRN